MAEDTGGEKSLPASGQKIQRAREEGNIAKSQDLSAGVALAVALLGLVFFGQMSFDTMLEASRHYLGNAHLLARDHANTLRLMVEALGYVTLASLPIALLLMVSGVLINLAQVGFLMTSKPLIPKFSRINPLSGFKRFFSLRSAVELVKSILKLVLVLFVVWLAIRDRVDELLILQAMTPTAILYAVSGLVYSVWWRIALVMTLLGAADYAYQRWQHLQDLRMTQQEARQESKEMEGDPQIKRRVRQLQRQIAMQRMMTDVPSADVIITNPIRFAVALRYDMGNMDTPVVVAKGTRKMAERIREIANENNVPIVQKPELARALYKSIEVGQGIPENLFLAVAEVLSFVYRIDRRRDKIRERQAAWSGGEAR